MGAQKRLHFFQNIPGLDPIPRGKIRVAVGALHVAHAQAQKDLREPGIFPLPLHGLEYLDYLSFNAHGSVTPASLNPFALKMHESHTPQGYFFPA